MIYRWLVKKIFNILLFEIILICLLTGNISRRLTLEPAPLTKECRKNSSPGGLVTVTAIIRVTALGKKCRKNSRCENLMSLHIHVILWRTHFSQELYHSGIPWVKRQWLHHQFTNSTSCSHKLKIVPHTNHVVGIPAIGVLQLTDQIQNWKKGPGLVSGHFFKLSSYFYSTFCQGWLL